MAKVKLSDLFKFLGLNDDDDIEIDTTDPIPKKESKPEPVKQPEPKAPYEEGFYVDGKFNLNKINDKAFKDAISDYLKINQAKDNQRLIDDAYQAELKTRKLGISESTFKKVIDLSGVKVIDGKVTGMKEAFDALNNETGIYKKASNPIYEGFNPVDNKSAEQSTMFQSFDEVSAAHMEYMQNINS